MASSLKRLLLGDPLTTAQAKEERLGKVTGLAVFASDALSSVAYATEEILLALALAGTAAFAWTLPIGTAIGLLLVNRLEDGVVTYKSAHLEGVASEKIVRSGHSTQGHPDTILEVRRILLEHVEAR